MSTSILVVGAGSIGQRHASNLAALGADVAITDTDSARLVGVPWRTAAGIADGFDAMVIASPTTCHAEQALAALDTGAAVFVEKPLALTVDEGERLVEVGGERITVGYNLRFHEPLRRLAQLMAAGRAGRPLSYRFWFGQWLPDWRPTVDYRQTYSARADLGGGVLLDAIHELDLALWVAGPDLSVVGATVARLGPLEIDVEDTVRALLTTPDGVPVSIELDYLARQYRRGIEVIGDAATIRYDWATGDLTVSDGDGTTTEHFDTPVADSYVAEMAEFLSTPAAPTNTAAGALASLRLAESIRAAALVGAA